MFVGHGVVSPALFLIRGLLYIRSNTRIISGGTIFGNLFLFFFLFIVITNFRFPPLINFFREIRIFYSLFSFSELLRVVMFFGFFFSRVYIITIFTSVNSAYIVSKDKLSFWEFFILVSLFISVFFCTFSLLFLM